MKFTPMTTASALLGRTRRQRYQQIPDSDGSREGEHEEVNGRDEAEREENHALIHTKLWTLQIKNHMRLITALVTFIAILIVTFIVVKFYRKLPEKSCDTVDHGYHCKPSISKYWGQYSPYFSVPSDISSEIPAECSLTFAQVLSRHGARDPTLGKTLQYSSLIEKIHSQTKSYSEEFRFLKSYKYELGADQLTDFGQQQMVNSGQQFYNRYAELNRVYTPFVRASGQHRVIESAQNWTQGFHFSRLDDELANSPEDFPYSILVIPETSTSNNTLSYGLCPNFHSSFGQPAQSIFASKFTPPILARLKQNLVGAALTTSDAIALMDLCPFSTVSYSSGKVSEFCDLFTEDEWKAYDYYQSLGKFHGFTFPNPLGPTQGVGWVNELIARLTGSAVQDSTCTNRTLDEDQKTFPTKKGGRGGLYADFSHDNDMSTVFAALGLYNNTVSLSPKKIDDRDGSTMDGYAAAYTVPFAARMYVEKMDCKSGESSASADVEEYVRVLVNDRVMPLKTCGGDELGRCTLEKFVASLTFAKSGGHWDQCFTDVDW